MAGLPDTVLAPPVAAGALAVATATYSPVTVAEEVMTGPRSPVAAATTRHR